MSEEKPKKKAKPKVAKVSEEDWSDKYAERFEQLNKTVSDWKAGKLALPWDKVKDLKKALADLRKVKPRTVTAGAYDRKGLVYCSLTEEQKGALQRMAKDQESSVAGLIKPVIIAHFKRAGVDEFAS